MPAAAGVGRAPPAGDWGRRLRQLLHERWRQGLAFGLLITTVDLLRTYSVFLPQGLAALGAVVAETLVYTVTVSMATFLAVQAVAATSLEGGRRWLAVLSALVAGNGASGARHLRGGRRLHRSFGADADADRPRVRAATGVDLHRGGAAADGVLRGARPRGGDDAGSAGGGTLSAPVPSVRRRNRGSG